MDEFSKNVWKEQEIIKRPDFWGHSDFEPNPGLFHFIQLLKTVPHQQVDASFHV